MALVLLAQTAICAVPDPLTAEQRELKNESAETLDAVLLLDASGSMLLTDPHRLRDEGVKLFIQFLKSGDRLGIISFSGNTKIVRPLVDFNPADNDEIAKQIARIENTGIYTDLVAAIDGAKNMLANSGRSDATPTIILLSDGKMDPDPSVALPQARVNELINSTLPELKAQGLRVHTLSFSSEADSALLEQIAAITDGVSMFTPDAERIHESYANLFLAVKKPQIVPLTSKGFKIDTEIQEATFYVDREDETTVEILDPSGRHLTQSTKAADVRWFHGQKFDVVTIPNPEPGDWHISGLAQNDGYATVMTNLKLVTDWPLTVVAGNETLLQARLYESDKPVVLPEMSGAANYAFQVVPTDKISEPIIKEFLYDDGTHGDKIQNDGIFSSTAKIMEPGEYKLKVIARAPTFERVQQIPFKVKPRMITLAVAKRHAGVAKAAAAGHAHAGEKDGAGHGDHGAHDHGDGHAAEGHGAQGHGAAADSHHEDAGADHPADAAEDPSVVVDYFEVTLSPEVDDLRKLEVKLVVTASDRTRYSLAMVQSDRSHVWEMPVSALPKTGLYQAQATVSGLTRTQKTVKESSDVITYNLKELIGEAQVLELAKEEHPKEHALELAKEQPKEQGPRFPWLEIIGTVIVNAGLGLAFLILAQRTGSTVSISMPVFESSAGALAVLSALEAKMAQSEVDLNDPIFSQLKNKTPGTAEGTSAEENRAAGGEADNPEEEEVALEGEAAPDEATEQTEVDS